MILILADDLAIGDLASQNGGISRTKNLDRLATDSASFRQAYSGSCVCAPARAALLTGRYPHRTGVVTLNMNKFPKLTQLRLDETTLADVLKSQGYATGLIGKWHLGKGAEYHPMRRGFDEFEGFSGSQELSYFRYTLDVNGNLLEVSDQYLTDDLSNRAIEFVRRHRAHPFFLHLAHYAPHRPIEAPEPRVQFFRDRGLDQTTATIYAMIESMDQGIGRLLDELEHLGLADNTIVVFASDNGPDPVPGERFNGSLRGTKYQVYEGGIRVPLFVRWPGVVPPGSRDGVAHFVDLMPTILDCCGIPIDPKLAIDGASLRPRLENPALDARPKRFFQWNRGVPNYTHNAAVLHGRWKLVRPFVTRGLKLQDSLLPPELFDLKNDPSESTDVTSNHPEIAAALEKDLAAWCDRVEADRLRPQQADGSAEH
ncbi:arylsulfatase [Stieleria sp. TO1_6]|nr:arylsulfatase [Stieleria tagensis]